MLITGFHMIKYCGVVLIDYLLHKTWFTNNFYWKSLPYKIFSWNRFAGDHREKIHSKDPEENLKSKRRARILVEKIQVRSIRTSGSAKIILPLFHKMKHKSDNIILADPGCRAIIFIAKMIFWIWSGENVLWCFQMSSINKSNILRHWSK